MLELLLQIYCAPFVDELKYRLLEKILNNASKKHGSIYLRTASIAMAMGAQFKSYSTERR